MFPIVIDLGRIELPLVGEVQLALPSYGLLFAVAALLAGFWFLRRARALGIPDDLIYNLCFYALLAGILGAKVALVLLDLHYYLANPAELLGTLRSAGVLIGGVVAGGIAFILYCRHHGLPLFTLGDAVAAPLALGQSVGRLGCFAAGCCWGREIQADHPLAVTFTDPVAHEQTGVPLHVPLVATQLIQLGNDLALACLLTWLWRRKLGPPGTVFWLYVLLYSVSRGVIEFWRGDAQRGLYFGNQVSTSQLLSLAGIVLALAMLFHGRYQLRQTA